MNAALLLIAAQMIGQPPKSPPEPGVGVELRFRDNSLMKLSVLDAKLEMTTEYGKLSIPFVEIRRIEFRMRLPEDVRKQIDTAIANLGHSQFKVREAAMSDLQGFQERAYPALLRAAATGSPEVRKRAEDLLTKLRDKLPEERLKVRDNDLVHAGESMFAGKIESAVFVVRTRQFGEAKIPLAELTNLVSMAAGAESTFTLAGNQYALPQKAWFDTKLEFVSGSALRVSASGEVDVYPSQPNVYVCSPKGRVRWGGDPGRQMNPEAGVLVGKIGMNGSEFVLGEKYDGTASGAGRLYLRIVESPWNVIPTGEYKVRVTGGSPP